MTKKQFKIPKQKYRLIFCSLCFLFPEKLPYRSKRNAHLGRVPSSNKLFIFKVHVAIDCPSMAGFRHGCSLGPFIKMCKILQPQISSVKIYALFISDRNPKIVKSRALSLCSMKLGWHSLMGIKL